MTIMIMIIIRINVRIRRHMLREKGIDLRLWQGENKLKEPELSGWKRELIRKQKYPEADTINQCIVYCMVKMNSIVPRLTKNVKINGDGSSRMTILHFGIV